jgi:hypothetical protein
VSNNEEIKSLEEDHSVEVGQSTPVSSIADAELSINDGRRNEWSSSVLNMSESNSPDYESHSAAIMPAVGSIPVTNPAVRFDEVSEMNSIAGPDEDIEMDSVHENSAI